MTLASAGAGGKHHSAVVTSDGESYTFGSNLHGQCGTGTLKSKDKAEGEWCMVLTPAGSISMFCLVKPHGLAR